MSQVLYTGDRGCRQDSVDGLRQVNGELIRQPPSAIAAWALARAERPMVTTSFGLHAAAMLHLVTRLRADIPVVWIDTGFNTSVTYQHAERLTGALGLDLRIYAPDLTRARLEAVFGGVPSAEFEDRYASFSADIKLRPFERALSELKPDVWFTGIRREETDWRRTQAMVTQGADGLLKLAPFFESTEADVEAYMRRHNLPFGDPLYYDPAKASPHLECGLHPRWSATQS